MGPRASRRIRTDGGRHPVAEGALARDELHGEVGVRGGDLSGVLEPRQPRANHHHALGGGYLRPHDEGPTWTPDQRKDRRVRSCRISDVDRMLVMGRG